MIAFTCSLRLDSLTREGQGQDDQDQGDPQSQSKFHLGLAVDWTLSADHHHKGSQTAEDINMCVKTDAWRLTSGRKQHALKKKKAQCGIPFNNEKKLGKALPVVPGDHFIG